MSTEWPGRNTPETKAEVEPNSPERPPEPSWEVTNDRYFTLETHYKVHGKPVEAPKYKRTDKAIRVVLAKDDRKVVIENYHAMTYIKPVDIEVEGAKVTRLNVDLLAGRHVQAIELMGVDEKQEPFNIAFTFGPKGTRAIASGSGNSKNYLLNHPNHFNSHFTELEKILADTTVSRSLNSVTHKLYFEH